MVQRAGPGDPRGDAPRPRGDGPWLLAIESASERASVALLRGGVPLALRATPRERPASETLLPTLLALLGEHGLAPAALDGIAVSIGPGSFTGLRVGAATAKGLAFGALHGVAAVPTLAALAAKGASLVPAPRVVATLDARREELYAAAYDGADPLVAPFWGPEVLAIEALAERIAGEHGPLLVVGEGADALAVALGERRAGDLHWLPAPEGAPDAEWVGRLGARMLAAGAGIAADALAPLYVRRAEAEVRRTGARFETA
jgi:tRNA threonylcarbamoyladenosine biosynthesis protein TsaB